MKDFQQFQEATRLKKEMGYDKGGTKKHHQHLGIPF